MGGIWRLIAPASFALTSAPLALWLILRRSPRNRAVHRADLDDGPGCARRGAARRRADACCTSRISRSTPASPSAIFSQIAWLKALAFGFERWLLRRFDRLITISAHMAERLVAKGVPPRAHRGRAQLGRRRPYQAARAGERLPRRTRIERRRSGRALFGNIGAKQGLGEMIAAARRLAARAEHQVPDRRRGPRQARARRRRRRLAQRPLSAVSAL